MRSGMATCTLVLVAVLVCGWLVVAQDEAVMPPELEATLTQMADSLAKGDTAALVDFTGESVLMVEGLGGSAEVLDRAAALDLLASLAPITVAVEEVRDEDVLVMGLAASVRFPGSVNVQGEVIEGMAELLLSRQGGVWVVRAIAMGPTEEGEG